MHDKAATIATMCVNNVQIDPPIHTRAARHVQKNPNLLGE
jgi:hypothetical protein